MTTELAVAHSANEIVANVRLIQEVMKAVFVKDVHYGVIPGTKKPTLYKAGAEKLLATFKIGVEPIVQDMSTTDEAKFRVLARGYLIADGRVIGQGVGEASSNEEKYKWRKAVCDEEYDATPVDRRREKWGKDWNTGKPETTKQVRTNFADVANTILKMAKKRAQVDLAITATAASDVFDQDLEDLPDGVGATEVKQPVAMPTEKKQPAQEQAPVGDKITGPVDEISEKSGTGAKGPWTKYGIKVNGEWLSTFSATDADKAQEAKQLGKEVTVTFTQAGKYKNVVAVCMADELPM